MLPPADAIFTESVATALDPKARPVQLADEAPSAKPVGVVSPEAVEPARVIAAPVVEISV